MACVYILHLEGSPTDIRYVGMTRHDTPKDRFRRHKYSAYSGSKNPVYDWMRKYGDTVVVSIVETGLSVEEAKIKEIHYISLYRQEGQRLLNVTNGGDGTTGYIFTDEVKNKMRTAKLGVKRTEEAKKRVSEGQRGRVHSEETKRKMSEAQKGKPRKPNSPEARAKISAALTGKKRAPFTEEHRQRISEAGKGKIPWNKKSNSNG